MGEEHGLSLVTQADEEAFSNPEPHTFSANAASPYTRIVRLTVKKGSDLIGRTVRESGLRKRFGVNVVAVRWSINDAKPVTGLSDFIIGENSTLLVDTDVDYDLTSKDLTDNFADIAPLKDGTAKEFVIGVRVKKGPGDGE